MLPPPGSEPGPARSPGERFTVLPTSQVAFPGGVNNQDEAEMRSQQLTSVGRGGSPKMTQLVLGRGQVWGQGCEGTWDCPFP